MKKLKEIYKFINEKFKNPRTRAATILSMYAIFFFVIFFLINTSRNELNTNTNNKEEIINYNNIQEEYEYIYNIEIKEKEQVIKYLITGKNSIKEKTNLIKLYDEEIQEYKIINSTDVIYNKDFINLNKIISYVNNLKYEYTTTYKNGNILKNYLVPLNKINNLYNSNEFVEINIYEQNNFINKVIIDLTNLENKNNNKFESIIYTLEYKNI